MRALLLILFAFTTVFAAVTDHDFHQELIVIHGVAWNVDGSVTLDTSAGDLYVFQAGEEMEALRQIVGAWKGSDTIYCWSGKNAPGRIVALENKATNSVIFASRTPWNEKEEARQAQLLGERCSGTTFFHMLLRDHCPELQFNWRYGWKHFPTWFEYSKRWIKDEETLFLVIFRDPFDWLRSFYNRPHHVAPHLKKRNSASFWDFITSEWVSINQDGTTMAADLNPNTQKPFQNILAMRSAKVRSFLELRKAKNHFFVCYEDLKKHPFAYLALMADVFQLKLKPIFSPYEYHLGTLDRPKPDKMPRKQRYFPLRSNERMFIDEQLDWELEAAIGYLSWAERSSPVAPVEGKASNIEKATF